VVKRQSSTHVDRGGVRSGGGSLHQRVMCELNFSIWAAPASPALAELTWRRLFWRVADTLDYVLTLAWLHIIDALAGPTPERPADQQLRLDRERIKRGSPRTARR
jgi:hypothetical protein